MHRPRLAARQQAAVVEEHVDQLPEHVVGGLDHLLADERVLAGTGNSHSAPEAAKASVRQPRRRAEASASATSSPPGSSAPKAIAMSSGSAISSTCATSGPPSRESPIAGSARLPTITGWTNSTVT